MFLGTKKDGTKLELDSKALTTHAAVLGSTGSGKSGLIIDIVEELQSEDIPVILLDIKGDMVNIALQEEYHKVQYLSPGGEHGDAVNVLANLGDRSRRSAIVSGLLAMVGENPDPMNGTHMYLSTVLFYLVDPTIESLIESCLNPEFEYLGALPIDDAYPKRRRAALARKLNALLMSPSFEGWTTGQELNLDQIVKQRGVTIYSVAHLVNEDEQIFAITFLMDELVKWMKKQSGSVEPRLVVAIDECLGLLPPYPLNPSTKEPILQLLKQARAFGMGMVLGTQNPVDIDYKALSNCNTWFVGRMTAVRDRDKVASAMASLGEFSSSMVSSLISKLDRRNFLMSSNNELSIFKTRDTKSKLEGPKTADEVIDLYASGHLVYRDAEEYEYEYEYEPEEKQSRIRELIPEEYEMGAALATVVALAMYGLIALEIVKEAIEWLR